MTHDPSRRLATLEEIMAGNNPFELVTIPPFGAMERWRAETLLIGSTSGIQDVYRTIRSDAAAQAARADEAEARTALIQHVCDKITDFEKRFDALEARLAEEDKRRADEARKAAFEEPIELPPDLTEYQTRTPPSAIGGDDTHPPGGELHSVPAKEEPPLELEDSDNIGDLPKELVDLPDPVPEPKGSVFPQPVSISLNKA